MKLKENDRVKHEKYGKGTIVYDDKFSSLPYLVEFDKKHRDFHNGGGFGKENHCYWCSKCELQKLQNENIKLDDLQFADILTLRNNQRYVVASGCMQGESTSYVLGDDTISDYYDINLKRKDDSESEYDIMKVERAGQVIYEREEAKEMTIAEISKQLGYEVKVVKDHE